MTAPAAAVAHRIRRARDAARRTLPAQLVERWDDWRSPPAPAERTDHDGYSLTTQTGLVVIDPAEPAEPTLGIYLFGGCDLPALFSLAPLVGPEVRRRVIIHQPGDRLPMCRADVLRQTLDDRPARQTVATIENLRLTPGYFAPSLFEPTFRTKLRGLGSVPRSVVVLSGGANVVRSAYRHKEHGFLIDPGTVWLRNKDRLDPAVRTWFTSRFERVGLISVEQFAEDLTFVVGQLRERIGAEVIVFNTLTVEPGVREHNYQLRRNPEGVRRLEFYLAMHELAATAGYHLIDVDTALKRHGVRDQVDFAHFPLHAYEPIAVEAARVLRETGLL
jgi:hypothetical protein